MTKLSNADVKSFTSTHTAPKEPRTVRSQQSRILFFTGSLSPLLSPTGQHKRSHAHHALNKVSWLSSSRPHPDRRASSTPTFFISTSSPLPHRASPRSSFLLYPWAQRAPPVLPLLCSATTLCYDGCCLLDPWDNHRLSPFFTLFPDKIRALALEMQRGGRKKNLSSDFRYGARHSAP